MRVWNFRLYHTVHPRPGSRQFSALLRASTFAGREPRPLLNLDDPVVKILKIVVGQQGSNFEPAHAMSEYQRSCARGFSGPGGLCWIWRSLAKRIRTKNGKQQQARAHFRTY